MTNGEDKVIDAEYQKLNDEKAQIDEKVKKIDKSIQVFSGFGWLLICAGVAAASFPFL